jgi:hypothetical protein
VSRTCGYATSRSPEADPGWWTPAGPRRAIAPRR